jgi:L-lactate dehydrogenase complex protein LldE
MLDDKLAAARATGAKTLVVTDVGCMLHLDGGARKSGCPFRVRHLAELLAEASPVRE